MLTPSNETGSHNSTIAAPQSSSSNISACSHARNKILISVDITQHFWCHAFHRIQRLHQHMKLETVHPRWRPQNWKCDVWKKIQHIVHHFRSYSVQLISILKKEVGKSTWQAVGITNMSLLLVWKKLTSGDICCRGRRLPGGILPLVCLDQDAEILYFDVCICYLGFFTSSLTCNSLHSKNGGLVVEIFMLSLLLSTTLAPFYIPNLPVFVYGLGEKVKVWGLIVNYLYYYYPSLYHCVSECILFSSADVIPVI